MDDSPSDTSAQGFTTFFAILVSPILPCLVLTLVWALVLGFDRGFEFVFLKAWIFGRLFLVFTYAALVILGIPIFYGLHALGVRGLWPFATAGFLAGGVLPFVIDPIGASQQHVGPLCAAIGVATAATAWSIRRPDLDPV